MDNGVFLITRCCLLSVFLKYFLTSKTVRSAVLLVGLCDSGKTLIFSRVSPRYCNVLHTATLSSRGCLADARLMCVCEWPPISCLGSCCQESTNGHRPPSPTAALHTKPKMTRWVKLIIIYHPFMMIMVYRFPLSLLHSGHHLDSDRPARTWQPSLAVPGEVQICSQVSACHVKSQVTWLIRPDHTLFSSPPSFISPEQLCLSWTAVSSRRKWETWQSSFTCCWRTLWSPGTPRLCWWRATNKVPQHIYWENCPVFYLVLIIFIRDALIPYIPSQYWF